MIEGLRETLLNLEKKRAYYLKSSSYKIKFFFYLGKKPIRVYDDDIKYAYLFRDYLLITTKEEENIEIMFSRVDKLITSEKYDSIKEVRTYE